MLPRNLEIVGYENVHMLLEAMPKFLWIQKLYEGQVVVQCSRHLEKLNMTRPCNSLCKLHPP
jgi:hypothetical protein